MIRKTSSRTLHRAALALGWMLAGAAFGAAATAVALSPAVVQTAPAPVEARARPSTTGVRATALKIVDGDTFEARVQAFPGQEIVARVRVDGIDAPERRGRCARETAAAEAATQALERIIADRALTLTELRGDKYFGRVVAHVSAAGVGDVAKALIAGGHGRAYAGGQREGRC